MPAARTPASCGLSPRTPEVVCDTVTNVRVTDRAIEETIFLNYSIRNAGIHELTFLLPASMADARISTPMLRRKTVAPVDPKAAGSPLAGAPGTAGRRDERPAGAGPERSPADPRLGRSAAYGPAARI